MQPIVGVQEFLNKNSGMWKFTELHGKKMDGRNYPKSLVLFGQEQCFEFL